MTFSSSAVVASVVVDTIMCDPKNGAGIQNFPRLWKNEISPRYNILLDADVYFSSYVSMDK